jgi:formyltetrahydrofolate-dependent phosphoribosylglycinamide formyltransferase
MFERLQQKWKVSATQFFLILCTFAVTGTLTAWISRQATGWLGWDSQTHWGLRWGLRLFILIFGYQFIILAVGFCFGQFRFFWNYEKKILRRLGLMKGGKSSVAETPGNKTTNSQRPTANNHQPSTAIAIFASGAGSNAQQIINRFRHHPQISVALIVCNKPGAGVLQIAQQEGIPTLLIERDRFFSGDAYLSEIKKYAVDFVALAGFLWKIPPALIGAFPQKIVNIHPALLPQYGGKGMYGAHVHEAVIAAGETESGITIHYVDEWYDHGQIILQKKCTVAPGDTPTILAQKIHALEHAHYPEVIEKIVLQGRVQ